MRSVILCDAYEEAKRYLKTAEELYGPADKRFTFRSVQAEACGPLLRYDSVCTCTVDIVISTSALEYPNQRTFQLSHEVVHLLAPCSGPTIWLEEGMAVKFSLEVPTYSYEDYAKMARDEVLKSDYGKALTAFEELLVQRADAVSLLRSRKPALHQLTTEDLIEALDIPKPLAETLTCKDKLR